MKKLLVIFLFLSHSAMALIADEFDCEVRRLNFLGQSRFVSAARLVGLRTTEEREGAIFSKGEVELRANEKGSEISLFLSYRHAQRNLDSTVPLAVQHLCLQGLHSSQGVSTVSTTCLNPSEDPFGLASIGWHEVAVEEGIPVFDSESLKPVVLFLSDGDQIELKCDHRKTVFD